MEKFLPASLGITTSKIRLIEAAVAGIPDGEKTTDVFFAGAVYHSTVRQDGLRCLRALAQSGLRIECIEDQVPFEEFVRRMRRAWLVWSPEGQGWDCYRHYEACLAGSVPLMNYPLAQRYKPLLDGVHCILYAVEGDDLGRQIGRALADRTALRSMAVAARAHVLANHTDQKQGLYMASRLLNPPPTGMDNAHFSTKALRLTVPRSISQDRNPTG